MSKIIWTKIDEAPALATYSLLPIVNAFTKAAGIDVVSSDISLAARVISKFPERLTDAQKIDDNLAELGNVVQQADGNIIKLPNISASIPQLMECIAELQGQGYDIPNFPENPQTEEEKALATVYSTCLGSAVNPVLREGNSDRRAAAAVKKFAQNHPHKLRPFSENSKSYVASMSGGDFYENEQSVIIDGEQNVTIELNGKVLRNVDARDKEVLDATYMSAKALRKFLKESIIEAKEKDVLWSLHLKATMMKVSDPIMFGHAVEIFFEEVFTKYADEFAKLGVNANLGLGDLEKKLENSDKKEEILAALKGVINDGDVDIAMVDSDKGITNLHASNDIIIDASLPVVIRDGGKMWNKDGKTEECVAIIPDRSYANFYRPMMEDCVQNGQYDVTTMGSVANVGLMAQKAEEYGSHPTTIEVPEDGIMEVKDANGTVLMSHNVEKGDIYRMSRAKDIPIKDWVRLAVERASIEKVPTIFWLDENRAHDANMIKKVNEYLKDHDTEGLDIRIMEIEEATKFSNTRVREGKNTIAVTGNVLRDYLTDMYPILELGTSAKMLSIVPLLAGGGLYETGAGGSAPKHVDQFLKEGHLRWDSLGEFLALAESLRFLAKKNNSNELATLTAALDIANDRYLSENKSPSRKCGELDNKASHFFVAQFWAKALAESENAALAAKFAPIALILTENEETIISELLASEGKAKDIGGYFNPDEVKAEAAMRPSATLNAIIDSI